MATSAPLGLYKPANGEVGWGTLVRDSIERVDDRVTDVAVNVKAASYGALGTGSGNDGPALNAAFAAAGGRVLIPPGEYLCSTQPFINRDDLEVWAHGAVIKTTGAISGLKLSGFRNKIHGLVVDHQGNSAATCGYELLGVNSRNRFYDCNVFGDSSLNATYAAWRLRNGTASDNSTGSFWTRLIGCGTQSFGGAKPFAFGVLLEGAANHTVIDGGVFSDVDTMLCIRDQSGDTTHALSNAVRMHDTAVESANLVCLISSGSATSNILGPMLISNRFEAVDTILSITGVTTQPSVPPALLFNDYAGTPTTYINNPNNIHVNALDLAITPNLGASASTLRTPGGLVIQADGSGPDPLTIWAGGGSRGLTVRDSAGGGGPQLQHVGTGTRGRMTGWGASDLYHTGTRGISQTTTDAENLRGSVTFSTSGTATVTFANTEANGTYFISLAGNANETFWVTGKGTGGFTMHSSNGSSTATVDWVLIR